VEVAYGQEHRAGVAPFPRPITLSAGDDKFVFGTTNIYRTRGTQEKPQVEIRRARVPVSFFATAAGAGTTELREGDQAHVDSAPRVAKLSSAGLAKSLRALSTRCAQPVDAGGAGAAVPPQPAASAAVPGAAGLQRPSPTGEGQGGSDGQQARPLRSP
jgi:hypothetical protein